MEGCGPVVMAGTAGGLSADVHRPSPHRMQPVSRVPNSLSSATLGHIFMFHPAGSRPDKKLGINTLFCILN